MKYYGLLLLALSATASATDSTSTLSSPHIVGGEEAEPHAYPYQVALDITHDGFLRSFCGGSLLTAEWVLTAAHCVNAKPIKVEATFGAHEREIYEETKQVRQVEKIILHPKYDSRRFQNDVALLKVSPVNFVDGVVSTIRLPSESQRTLSFWRYPVTLTGWGRDKDEDPASSPVLRTVTTKVVTNVYCIFRYFNWDINGDHICADGSGRKGTCHGDSGGPMVIKEEDGKYTQIGVISFVVQAGCERSFPTGLARVTSYLDWIYNETGIKPRL